VISRGVVALALRRALAPSTWVVCVLVALIASGIDWSSATGLPRGDALVLRGLERRGLWIALAATLALATLARAAGQHRRWRERELDFVAAAPLARPSWLVSTWCGDALALAVLVAACGGFVELALGGATSSQCVVGNVALPRIALVESRSRVEWELESAPEVAHARLALLVAGGGRAAEVRWLARRGELASATTATVGLATTLELELPRGEGPVAFELERLAVGAIVVADPAGLTLTTPVADDRVASFALALRLWPALCAADALALGLGTWLSVASAFAAAACLWLVAWLAVSATPLVPAYDWFEALDWIAAGLVAPQPELASFVGAAGLVIVGLRIGAARAWTRSP
jgi:hypothetical protein